MKKVRTSYVGNGRTDRASLQVVAIRLRYRLVFYGAAVYNY